MTIRIPYNQSRITKKDRESVENALNSNWLAGNGDLVREFEQKIAEYTEYKYAIAVSSATAGLFVAYSAVFPYLNIPQGSKITMPANTFVATANMAIAAGYIPQPIDTDADGVLRNRLTHVSVAYSGNPEPQGIVGDDAHYVMRGMGNRAQLVSVLSTHAIKPITTGEGGVILTNHRNLFEQMKQMVDHGRGQHENGFGYGFNFRMPSLNAALGISQLEQADINLSRRQAIAREYESSFHKIEQLVLPNYSTSHCFHLYPVYVKPSQKFNNASLAQFLLKNGIGTQKHYPSLDSYDHINADRPAENARDYYRNMLSLPMSAAMTKSDTEEVIKHVRAYFGAK